ncbi:MAG: hypothetical protein LUQ24_05180 [Methanobacterium sp.]|nr:hypothetical protein [Methanobacterium sp.]
MKENDSRSKKAPLTNSERILALLFGFGFIIGFILTPLGVEPRMPELRTLAFAGFFITVGLLLPLAGLVSLWLRKNRLAGVLAVIDAVLLFLTAPADQALFFFTVAPPPAVTIGEYILIFVGIGYMLYGPRVYERTQSVNH